MTTLVLAMTDKGLTRSIEEDENPHPPEYNAIDILARPESAIEVDTTRENSPLSSVCSIASKPVTSTSASLSTPPAASAAKRRKLTSSEKEAVRAEKEQKEAQKVAERAAKEEEKRLKVVQKKQKDEEKEEKRRQRETERATKEQERRQKQDQKDAERKAKEDAKRAQEEAKAKKDRSQMRLTGFFGKPRDAASPSPAEASRQGSVCSIAEECSPGPSPAKSGAQPVFLPFEPSSHTTVAPFNRFLRDGPALQYAQKQLEERLRSDSDLETQEKACGMKRSLEEAFQPPVKRTRYAGSISVKSIIARMQGSQSQPIDLTASSSTTELPRDALRKVSLKQLKFKEDIRPPYIGTYSKVPEGWSLQQLSRKPFRRALPKVNYDYDSEAEWEEPEEGEDLISEGEEELDDEDDEDMEGFLDDDDAEGNPRRRQVLGDMEPVFTGIHWESGRRTAGSDQVQYGEAKLDLKDFRIEAIIEDQVTSINPFSTVYWAVTIPPLPTPDSSSGTTAMAPPRIPLNSIPSAANVQVGQLTPSNSSASAARSQLKTDLPPSTNIAPASCATAKSKGRPASAPLPAELLEEFKNAVSGSDLTKVGLIEVLKKKFPQASKNTVQETLERVAIRVGEKNADKRWVLKV